jgi:hypothetical protein
MQQRLGVDKMACQCGVPGRLRQSLSANDLQWNGIDVHNPNTVTPSIGPQRLPGWTWESKHRIDRLPAKEFGSLHVDASSHDALGVVRKLAAASAAAASPSGSSHPPSLTFRTSSHRAGRAEHDGRRAPGGRPRSRSGRSPRSSSRNSWRTGEGGSWQSAIRDTATADGVTQLLQRARPSCSPLAATRVVRGRSSRPTRGFR